MKRPALALLSPGIALLGLGLTLATGFPALGADGTTVSLPETPEKHKEEAPSGITAVVMPDFKAGAARWYPPNMRPEKWEWVLLNTGEWLKGTISSIRDDRMDFDSDKFDDVRLKMKDVVETRSPVVNTFVFTDQRVVVGVGQITPDQVIIETESGTETLPREQLISLAVGSQSEWRLWSGKVSAGVSSTSGNTSQMTANLQASIERLGPFLRLQSSYYGNFGESDGANNVRNQQLNFQADLFIRDRLFLIPAIFEYYSDDFANIGLRIKPGAGVGYQLARGGNLDWKVTGVGQYQRVNLFSAPPGEPRTTESFALTLATDVVWDVTSDTTLDVNYSVTIPTDQGTSPDQQAILTVEIDLTQSLTVNATLNWTRIGDPMELADSTTPSPNDLSVSFGFGFNF
ncbi:MAG: DUF481 domain-containing protein [Myxococcota bacterium]|nr:DUF481 domain-containing protein [Myxococcota bacterium]